ncbi:MAG: sigma-70 family RNA polymerase sigma factor [Lysobacteraceae bacterium]|jgi:RNA polymerase sigma factor (TIGR02999 family)|nr:MAG: sigma-70 family RNA polymerase sigma factor [Xanthomonadaceae bacterium]
MAEQRSAGAADLGAHADTDPPRLVATAQRLAPLLLAHLRSHARHARRRVRAGETLCTTALVHEAFLRLQPADGWHGEQHFLRAAALAMRQALVDHARMKLAAKRGGGATLSLEEAGTEPWWDSDERLVELHEALQRLSVLSPRLTRVVECRFFGGYCERDTARILGVTERTIRRDWLKARAWLYRELGGVAASPGIVAGSAA